MSGPFPAESFKIPDIKFAAWKIDVENCKEIVAPGEGERIIGKHGCRGAETSNPKHQPPKKSQTANSKQVSLLAVYLALGIWSLEFGAFHAPFPPAHFGGCFN